MLQSTLEDIARAKWPIRPEVFRRWQHEIQRALISQADAQAASAPEKKETAA